METPFSFHCRCCIEWFHEKRYPVVLPCGHTYVCNECADRFEVCMECREPLYEITVPSKGPDNSQCSHRSLTAAGRRFPSPQTPTKPQPAIKKRKPLPKNLVLMSLIEATELAAKNVSDHQKQEPSIADSPVRDLRSNDSMVDDEVEEEKIKYGTSLAISDCGTYAVAAKDGLEIFPSRPVSALLKEEDTEEDVDNMVRFFHLEHTADAEDGGSSQDEHQLAPPARLSLGDRVQIVSLENGWAKLSRGYGYVRADGLKLVKVGGSVDRACKLEALLQRLSTRRKELRTEQVKVDNDFIALMNELQVSLIADEDLTVIVGDIFENNKVVLKEEKAQVLEEERPHITLKPRPEQLAETPPPRMEVEETKTSDSENQPPLNECQESDEYNTPVKPSMEERPVSPALVDTDYSPFLCGTPDGLFSSVSVMPSYYLSLPSSSSPRDEASVTSRVEDTPRLAPRTISSVGDETEQRNANHAQALRDGARAWRATNGTVRRAPVINWSGLSSHHGALCYNPPAQRRSVRSPHYRMSAHSGLHI